MSIDVSRTYIIPIDRLSDAFAAAAEIAPRVREPESVSIALPDGSSVAFPFAPEEDPPYTLEVGGYLSFEYGFRASGDDIEDYVRRNPEPPFAVKRLKGGGLRAIFWLDLIVAIEPPFASFGFHNLGKDDCDVLDLRSVRDVLDYIGRCAEGLVTYETVMGEHRLLSPFESDLPSWAGDEDDSNLARIVAFACSQGDA